MKPKSVCITASFFLLLPLLVTSISCNESIPVPAEDQTIPGKDGDRQPESSALLLLLDEESIDDEEEPNGFSERDINDDKARVGQRQTLRYFHKNIGREINLHSGQVGDEGWFAIRSIPGSWDQAGPTASGARNFLVPGPGLGAPHQDGDREALLDEVPDVIPLRARGLAMLRGKNVLAVVYDSDISINYDPLEADLEGDNLGLVALHILRVEARLDGSSSDLPVLRVRILDAETMKDAPLFLFENAPKPTTSSSEPFDIVPPTSTPDIRYMPAD